MSEIVVKIDIMKTSKKYGDGKILPIIKAGNQILMELLMTPMEENLRSDNEEYRQISLNLLATSYRNKGAGLAAPQIGLRIRMFVMTIHPTSRYPAIPEIPDEVVISPWIISVSNQLTTLVEGCLSIPGFYAAVTRPESIEVSYLSFDFKTGKFKNTKKRLNGFAARVFQHEYDHTNGILFPSRVKNWKFCAAEDNRDMLRTRIETGTADFPFSLL